MSAKHPVIAVTGSSGAGTTTVKNAFEHIFFREQINPLIVEGDSYHKFDRAEMKEQIEVQDLYNAKLDTSFFMTDQIHGKVLISVMDSMDIEFIEGALTKEVMDNYERYFFDISDDSDFNEFNSQEDKHKANICQCLARGERNFIEGYGSVDNILKRHHVSIYGIEHA